MVTLATPETAKRRGMINQSAIVLKSIRVSSSETMPIVAITSEVDVSGVMIGINPFGKRGMVTAIRSAIICRLRYTLAELSKKIEITDKPRMEVDLTD